VPGFMRKPFELPALQPMTAPESRIGLDVRRPG